MNIEDLYKTRNGVVNLVEIAQGVMNTVPDADDKFMEPVVFFIDAQQYKIEELEADKLEMAKAIVKNSILLNRDDEEYCLHCHDYFNTSIHNKDCIVNEAVKYIKEVEK